MDMTSYLLGRKSSGGSSGIPVIFTTENENGVLDIKPSDIIDANGKLQNKYYVLKFESGLQNVLIPFYMTEIANDTIYLGFGDAESFMESSYTASISGDTYFTHFQS